MASIVAERVANEVLGTLGRGKIPNVTEIAVKNGYTFKTANAGAVQKTKTYQQIIAKNKDKILKKLVLELAKVQDEMTARGLEDVQYTELAKVADTLIKNMQILTGGQTGEANTPVPILQIGVVNFTAIQNNTVVKKEEETHEKIEVAKDNTA